MSDLEDFRALAEKMKAALWGARLTTFVLYGLLALSLFFVGKCSGKGEGKDDVKESIAKQEIASAKKEAKKADDSAKVWKHKADSLEKKKDSVKVRYIHQRDTLEITDTVKVKEFVAVTDTVIATQDSLIGSLKKRGEFLEVGISARDREIHGLNERLSISSRRIGRARREGFVVGGFVGAFAVLSVFASK